jgi:branched-chain amino acid transport system permease protein
MILATFTDLEQFAVDGLINGSLYGLIGLSFGLIVAVTGRFHFAWAIAFGIAGYFSAYFVNHYQWPILLAVIVWIAGSALFSILLELFIYRPVAARSGANALLAVFVASFGVTLAGANLIRLIVQARVESEPLYWVTVSTKHIGTVTFTSLDIISVITVWACAVILWALLRYTPLGRQIRAVQVNPTMAQAVGIRPEWTYVIVFAIGSILAGVVAVLYAMKNAATPDMGLDPVFYAFVVAFLAGLGRSPLWIMVVGTALGVLEGISADIVSTEWQPVVVFGILLVLLVLRAAAAWRPTTFRRLPAVITR